MSNELKDLIILKAVNLAELVSLTSMNKSCTILAKEILSLRDKLETLEPEYLSKLYTNLLNSKLP